MNMFAVFESDNPYLHLSPTLNFKMGGDSSTKKRRRYGVNKDKGEDKLGM